MFAISDEKRLIERPFTSGTGPPTLELVHIGLVGLTAPVTDGLIRDYDPRVEQQLFNVPIAQAEATIRRNAMADDFYRKRMMSVRIGGCGGSHYSFHYGLSG
jgi:hypothetical protein